ncbi:MAG: DUF3482 domain-containing protein [Oligoflexus sp.]
MSLPKFAVIGRVNRGKSSIVAVLVEDDTILIGPEPGTTTKCRHYPVCIDAQILFEVIDTPGFQCPEEMLEILQDLKASGHDYLSALQFFYQKYRDSDEFHDECQILEPILAGAKVLYVVDASKPFRPNMATELEILRWTGAPRIAILNYIGEQDFSHAWEQELRRSFNLIRRFDAFHSRFHDRIQLLQDFRLIVPSAVDAIDTAVEVLKGQHEERLEKTAEWIVDLLKDSALYSVKSALRFDIASLQAKRQLQEDAFQIYQKRFSEKEQETRKKIEREFRFSHLEREESLIHFAQFTSELFTKEGWRLWGLSQSQYVKLLAFSGASSGLLMDLATAGFGVITLSGALLGGAAALFASSKTVRQLLAIKRLGSDEVQIGPIKSPQFYIVVFHRALAHFHYLQLRTHAMRNELQINHEQASDVIKNNIREKELKEFFDIMRKISKGKNYPQYRSQMQGLVLKIIRRLGKTPTQA